MLQPSANRAKNRSTVGVISRYGSSTHPIVTVAPNATRGPTQFWVGLRGSAAEKEWMW